MDLVAFFVLFSCWTLFSHQTTIMNLNLWIEEQSDLGLHCLPFHLHLLDTLLYDKPCAHGSNFRMITTIFWVSEFFEFLWYVRVPELVAEMSAVFAILNLLGGM